MTTPVWLTIIGLVITAGAFLHHTLISRKQAIVETLTEKNDWLEKQLAAAKENSPDVLAERLSKRVTLLRDEIERLSEDQNKNELLIKQKEMSFPTPKQKLPSYECRLQKLRAYWTNWNTSKNNLGALIVGQS